MAIIVDIADRLYDYTDEEKAADAVAQFQDAMGLDDQAVVALWADEKSPQRGDLEKLIFDAIDANGTVKRALESVPCGVSLSVCEEIDG